MDMDIGYPGITKKPLNRLFDVHSVHYVCPNQHIFAIIGPH
jgi:hypothetical protein